MIPRSLGCPLPLARPPCCSKLTGGHGGGGPPLPVPNRAVKPARADGTAGVTLWESRSPPVVSSTQTPAPCGRLPFFPPNTGRRTLQLPVPDHRPQTSDRQSQASGHSLSRSRTPDVGRRPRTPVTAIRSPTADPGRRSRPSDPRPPTTDKRPPVAGLRTFPLPFPDAGCRPQTPTAAPRPPPPGRPQGRPPRRPTHTGRIAAGLPRSPRSAQLPRTMPLL
jgi:hypothetical protein